MSTKETMRCKLTVHNCVSKRGNMKLLEGMFRDDVSYPINELIHKNCRPQLIDVESSNDEKSFNENLAEIYSNNPRLVNVHAKVKKALKEKGLL